MTSEPLIAGRFAIRRLLGSGGTAAVFAADDTLTGRRIALKLLHPHLSADPATAEAFFEEVRAARSIAHPGLAEILDAGVDDRIDPPVVWIAMELVTGVTLADHVRAHGAMAPADVATLAVALLDALAAAHEGGIVHRDVTPANVMFDPGALGDRNQLARSVRLLDFGLADIPGRPSVGGDALLSTGAAADAGVVTSVPYASPEHLAGAPVTEASDMYQLGATLYVALTGRAPFTGDTRAVIRAHLTAPPPLPSVVRRELSRDWDRLLTTALLKSPADRYATAARMRAAVPGAAPVAGETDAVTALDPDTGVTRVYRTRIPAPTAAAGVAPPPPAVRSPRARRLPVAVATAVVGALVLVGVVALSAAAGSAPSAVPTLPPSVVPTGVTPTPTPDASPAAPAAVTVPDVTGAGLAQATEQLIAHGFVVGAVSRVDAAVAAETVLASDPAAGETRPAGATVTLRVASGRNAIPAVAGLTAADAAGVLAGAGFDSTIVEAGSGTPGLVAGSAPAAGESAMVGTAVVLTVPRAPVPTVTPTPSVTPTATPSPAP